MRWCHVSTAFCNLHALPALNDMWPLKHVQFLLTSLTLHAIPFSSVMLHAILFSFSHRLPSWLVRPAHSSLSASADGTQMLSGSSASISPKKTAACYTPSCSPPYKRPASPSWKYPTSSQVSSLPRAWLCTYATYIDRPFKPQPSFVFRLLAFS